MKAFAWFLLFVFVSVMISIGTVTVLNYLFDNNDRAAVHIDKDNQLPGPLVEPDLGSMTATNVWIEFLDGSRNQVMTDGNGFWILKKDRWEPVIIDARLARPFVIPEDE